MVHLSMNRTPISTRSVLLSQETIDGWRHVLQTLMGFLVLKMHLECARRLMVRQQPESFRNGLKAVSVNFIGLWFDNRFYEHGVYW